MRKRNLSLSNVLIGLGDSDALILGLICLQVHNYTHNACMYVCLLPAESRREH